MACNGVLLLLMILKVGILVSKLTMLCLSYCGVMHVVLYRVKLPVISNHEDLREAVENFGIPFTVIKVTKRQ